MLLGMPIILSGSARLMHNTLHVILPLACTHACTCGGKLSRMFSQVLLSLCVSSVVHAASLLNSAHDGPRVCYAPTMSMCQHVQGMMLMHAYWLARFFVI